MDNIFKNSEYNDLNETSVHVDRTVTNEKVDKRDVFQSPTFKIGCHKTVPIQSSSLSFYSESSDYDLPSYQINQSVAKCSTASKTEQESNEIALPFSPVFSPVAVSVQHFRPPSIHSLGSIAKKNNRESLPHNLTKPKKREINANDESQAQSSVFDNLLMADTDISWASSMASPLPAEIPTGDFNTIEKATFFPEEKFQKIQPRALFSPNSDDSFGFSPLLVSSESEGEEAYKTNVRLSDVCATLKELEFESLKQELNECNKSESPKRKPLSCITTAYPTSPVFIIKPKKVILPKKKDIVIRSPESICGNQFLSCKVAENEIFCDKENNSETNCSSDQNSTIKQEESFLDVSFTELDNMCNTLINSKNKTDSIMESQDLSDTALPKKQKALSLDKLNPKNILKPLTIKKHFYVNEHSTDVDYTGKYFSSFNEILNPKYNLNFKIGNKIIKSHKDNNFWTECNQLLGENDKKKCDFKGQRIHKANTKIFKKESKAKDFKEPDKSVSDNDSSLRKEKVIHVGMLEEEEKMLEAVEEAEKTLAEEAEMVKAADEMENTKVVDENEESSYVKKSGIRFIELEKPFTTNCVENIAIETNNEISSNFDNELKISKGQIEKKDVFFSRAAGSKLSVSEKSLIKSKAFLDECELDITLHGIGAPRNCSTPNSFTSNLSKPRKEGRIKIENLEKSTENLEIKFITCLGQEVKVSNDALEKAKFLMASCSENLETSPNNVTLSNSINELNKFKDHKYTAPAFYGFSTASGIKVSVSEKSLSKAKKLMAECDREEEKMESLNRTGNSFGSNSVRASSPKAITIESADSCLEKNNCKEQKFAKKVEEKEQKSNSETLIANFDKNLTNYTNSTYSTNESCDFKTVFKTEVSFSSNSGDKLKASKVTCGKNELLQNYFQLDDMISSGQNLNNLKFNDNFAVGFSTGSGKKIKITNEALEKAQKLMSSCVDTLEDSSILDKASFEFIVPLNKETNIKACDSVTTIVSKCEKTDFVLGKEQNQNSSFGVEETCSSLPHGSQGTAVSKFKPKFAVSAEKVNYSSERSGAIQMNSKESTTNCLEISEIEKELTTKAVDDIILNCPRYDVQEKIKRKLLSEESEDESNSHVKKQIRIFSPPFKDNSKKIGIKRTFNDASIPCKRMKYLNVEENLDEQDENILSLKDRRSLARVNQEKIIKEKQKVKPVKGSLLMKKSAKQMSFREAVENSLRDDCSKDGHCLKISEAGAFRFSGSALFGANFLDNRVGLNLGDNFMVIPDDKNNFGVEEFKRAFLSGPGVQPNLVPEGWVENHYKWIVWKLSYYEKTFPSYFHGKTLTPNNVMLQLKYRYDREIDRNERSALKKILEKDDTSIKRMVLRVCEIKKVKNNIATDYELILTDGWYSCPSKVDSAMTKLIDAGKISVGTKLITQGAILVNCDQGVPPLEITEDIHLKIFTNSTRRITWDTKLGFQKNPGNLTISLDSVLPGGGPISRVDVIIVRVYPLLYLEKTCDGRRTVRNRRAEEKADSEYNRILEQRIEKICTEVRSEITSKDIKKTGDILTEADFVHTTQTSTKINSDYSVLFARQNDFSKEMAQKIEDRLKRENLNSRRNVTEFLKVKIVDLRKPNFINPTVLSIWSPDEDVINIFSEGKSLAIMNTVVSKNNFSRAGNFRQINATRQTRFKEINRINKYPARHLTPFDKISFAVAPIFGEIDLVGIVVLVEDESHSVKTSQLIYLADSNFNFAGLSLLDNYKDYGWKNVLVRRHVVACSNLIWKPFLKNSGVPVLQVCETSVFTVNPKTDHLKRGVEKLKKNLPKDIENFLSECEEKLKIKLEASKRQDGFCGNREGEQSAVEAVLSEERETKETLPGATNPTTLANSKSRETEKPQKFGKSFQTSFRWLPYKKV